MQVSASIFGADIALEVKMNLNKQTIDYYNTNAQIFVSGTISLDFSFTQEKFRCKLENGSLILDFGCGSGRDTKYFLEHGLQVHAMDGSEELCKIASAYTGIPVKHMLFQELCETDCYDGIWACSSILHLPKRELYMVIQKMISALKKNGIIYTSFKYGSYAGIRNGRYFTDFTEDAFADFMADIRDIRLEEQWVSTDIRADRGDEKWLNVILRKS